MEEPGTQRGEKQEKKKEEDVEERQEQEDDKDLYALLNCTKDATAEQIKTEYLVLARKFHPDKQRSKQSKQDHDSGRESATSSTAKDTSRGEAATRGADSEGGRKTGAQSATTPQTATATEKQPLVSFTRISHAYRVLSDPALRKQYDDWRAAGVGVSFNQWQASEMSSRLHFAVSVKKPMQLEAEQQQQAGDNEPMAKRAHMSLQESLTSFRQDQSTSASLRRFRGW